ncbi:transcriptional regulator [Paenibacillus dendritiformis]|uniref:helix-turn-helix transcriptional regulator n=1 Tax=Paenibacillus dendritiformis TaxID=130049 RepID=UPI001B1FB353|nr:metalloregulator ArsR/SmtB family transcription factor [Paenibacillus dendritiformis]GIO75630.1 transcriptional regulator [Paenibacillus dendritiformis]
MMNNATLSTREKIMHMLKTDGELSAKAMSERLGITLMAVRRHLNALERDHLIEAGTVRQPMGRPMSVYRLTPGADDYFPKNYHAVALELLAELAHDSGGDMVNRLFDLRQRSLFAQYESRLRGKDLADKIALLTDIQNEGGYMAEWDKINENEFVLTEYNCPIARIAKQYNRACACACELRLFEDLLGAEVERTSCLAGGDRKCVYRIQAANGGIRSAEGGTS